ncbi:MAG: hypothetical protein ACKOYK_13915 [Cyanobium sp.]
MLLTKRDQLTTAEYNKKATEVVTEGAVATDLVCAGPIGWLGLAGYSIVSAYNSATTDNGGQQPGARLGGTPAR